ncbi:GMC family oxidoreductase, partial [Rhizobium ruizarguesonis]
WGWATGAPTTYLLELVDDLNLYGADLRRGMIDQFSRQLLLAFMIEVMPVESNRIALDPQYTDALGNMRPILYFMVYSGTVKDRM